VVFYVILRRLGQDDVRLDSTDDGGDFGDRRLIVKDSEVVEQWRVGDAAHEFRGGLRFQPPDGSGFLARKSRRTAAAVGEIPEMDFAARILQAQERPGHHEFDVVGMSGSSENFHGIQLVNVGSAMPNASAIAVEK
jgi:hypothetical protein